MSKKVNKKLKVKADESDSSGQGAGRGEVYPDQPYEKDPQIHDPMAPEVTPPVVPVPKTEIPKPEKPRDPDDVLNSPLKYVVSAPEAIDKIESLTEKIEDARPDLKPELTKVNQAVQELERKATGTQAPPDEQAVTEEKFTLGDKVMVALEGANYNGEVTKDNEDGTYSVQTDQMMTLNRVPGGSMKKQESTKMALPVASLIIGSYTGDIDRDFDATDVDICSDAISQQKAKDPKEASKLAKYLAQRARQLYRSNTRWGRKLEKAERSDSGARDMLWMWMGHWADGWNARGGQPPVDPTSTDPSTVNAAAELNVMPVAQQLADLVKGTGVKHIGEWRYSDKNDSAIFEVSTPLESVPVKILVSVFENGQARTAPFQGGKPSGSDAEGTSEFDRFENLVGMSVMDTEPDSIGQMAEDVAWYLEQIDKGASSWEENIEARMKSTGRKIKAEQIAEGYTPVEGVFVVEDKGQPRAFDATKDDIEPAQLFKNADGKLALVSKDGISYEDKANDEVELSYWQTVKSLAPQAAETAPKPTEGAEPKEAPKEAGKPEMAMAAKKIVAAARERIKAKKIAASTPRVDSFVNKYKSVAIADALEMDKEAKAKGEAEDMTSLEDINEIVMEGLMEKWGDEYGVPESEADHKEFDEAFSKIWDGVDQAVNFKPMDFPPAKRTLAAKKIAAKLKAAKAVRASAFDEIPEIEIGGGMKARRKKSKKEKEGGEETKEIEVIDKEGKVIETYPDAFGDDTVMIIKFLRTVLDIKEADDKKAAEGKSKDEDKGEKKGDGEDISEKPRALPNVKDKEKDSKEKEDLEASAKAMEQRLLAAREVVKRMLHKGHIVASQEDVDGFLIQGKSLAEAQAAAAKKAVDKKVLDLVAQPEDELLLLKASLPLMTERQVTVRAPEGVLPIMNLSAAAVIDHSARENGVSFGALFGRGAKR